MIVSSQSDLGPLVAIQPQTSGIPFPEPLCSARDSRPRLPSNSENFCCGLIHASEVIWVSGRKGRWLLYDRANGRFSFTVSTTTSPINDSQEHAKR